jgi:serine/threonine protein kinase
LGIARIIASLAAQLHGAGIMHGDLYAHNTLIDDEGSALFGDFGAASFYNQLNAELVFALERIEVLAYGYLLDDLLSLHGKPLMSIALMRDACLVPDVAKRPGFQNLVTELDKID